MTTMMKTTAILTLLSAIAACDYAQKRDLRHERKDQRYQTAMAEYRAGRLDRALAGFEKLLKDDPSNASARFQTACLMQDSKRDFLGAFCNYREFLVQHPDSERAKLAKDRMAICERELARLLAEKYGIANGDIYAEEAGKIRGELAASERKRAELEKKLAELEAKAENLEEERKRMANALRAGTDTEKSLCAPSLKDAKALLEDEEDTSDRIALSQDVKSLKSEGDEELAHAAKGPAILPAQSKDAKAKRDAARKAAQGSRGDRPAEYTVEDGDTLYKIAERFYGRTSAWTEIRNANRTVISVDGRVKAGDRIVLP